MGHLSFAYQHMTPQTSFSRHVLPEVVKGSHLIMAARSVDLLPFVQVLIDKAWASPVLLWCRCRSERLSHFL